MFSLKKCYDLSLSDMFVWILESLCSFPDVNECVSLSQTGKSPACLAGLTGMLVPIRSLLFRGCEVILYKGEHVFYGL